MGGGNAGEAVPADTGVRGLHSPSLPMWWRASQPQRRRMAARRAAGATAPRPAAAAPRMGPDGGRRHGVPRPSHAGGRRRGFPQRCLLPPVRNPSCLFGGGAEARHSEQQQPRSMKT